MAAQVTTTSGPLVGSTGDGVTSFLGIPYAAPPVGDLRFAPPQPPEAWASPRDATRFGPAAPQPVDNLMVGIVPGKVVERDEGGCLTLNVWTPATDDARRPVLLWLHGGAFSLGATSLPVYGGARLARREDVVVVTANYRLGALGWLLLDDPTTSPNCGLLDQVAALAWIRDNIAAFGGDPANVTVFGESAGAGSVLSLLSAPAARPLISKAICQSGATDLLLTRAAATEVAELLAKHAGVAAGDVAALRALPVEVILAAQSAAAVDLMATVGTMPFHPVIDGVVQPLSWQETVASGAAAGIPLVIGTAADEMRLFVDLMPAPELGSRQRLLEELGALGAPDAEAVAAAYEAALPEPDGPVDHWWRARTDSAMWLPALRIAEAQAAHQPKTYSYRLEFRADDRRRAFHAMDIPFPFDGFDHDGWDAFVGRPAEARVLAHRVQDAWAAFARTGDPSCDALGPWPAFDAERRATMLLDDTCRVVDDPLAAVRHAWSG